MRGSEAITENPMISLRRFKDDVREILAGFEGGVGLDGFNEFAVGDILEFVRREKSA
jgi:translation initiation factor IF-2